MESRAAFVQRFTDAIERLYVGQEDSEIERFFAVDFPGDDLLINFVPRIGDRARVCDESSSCLPVQLVLFAPRFEIQTRSRAFSLRNAHPPKSSR